jgi:hypothetical protein
LAFGAVFFAVFAELSRKTVFFACGLVGFSNFFSAGALGIFLTGDFAVPVVVPEVLEIPALSVRRLARRSDRIFWPETVFLAGDFSAMVLPEVFTAIGTPKS